MYAMLVGKLPFRSSRNHSNPRAKLLQQISAGLGAHQESDAAHLHPCELMCCRTGVAGLNYNQSTVRHIGFISDIN